MSEDKSLLYSTDKGAVVIKSKTKNQIIRMLMTGEKTGGEIRDALDKAKSTISVHLSDLERLGIIKEKVHPTDSRKKIYFIDSKLLGSSKVPFDEHYDAMLDNLDKSSGDPYDFLKSLFHLIRYGLTSFGLDVHPALKEIGRDAGKKLGNRFEAGDLQELLQELSIFWKKNRLGRITIVDEKTILVDDCFDCCDMPDVGSTFCSLDEGLIEGVVEEVLGEKIDVKEIECFGEGSDHCKFVLED